MIYLDHNATTPLDERVLDAMLPYLGGFYGNPSGLYRLGRLCRGAIDTAREQVAALVGARPSEVIFTSGGTEANNLALKGLAACLAPGQVLYGATEHPSVIEPLRSLRRQGFRLTELPVDAQGQPGSFDPGDRSADELRIATLMLANNETGVIHDTAALGDQVHRLGGWFHVDAVQAAGKIPVRFSATGADTLTLSSHKLQGPKGVGALIAHRDAPLEALLHGGGQEYGLRGGTENVAGIVGFGKAAELTLSELDTHHNVVRRLRLRLEAGLKHLPGITIFAEQATRLPNTVLFSLPDYQGESLVMLLDRQGFAVSSGSACANGGGEPSPVLLAMGYDDDRARSAVRVSLGRTNNETEINRLLDALAGLMGIARPLI